MNLPDTSVWFALALANHPFYQVSRDWFAQCQPGSALFCRATQLSFVRLLTTQAVMRGYNLPALTNALAWQHYAALRDDLRVGWAAESPTIDVRLKSFAVRSTASPKLWMDAYLAAFAVEGHHRLITTDHAFNQFKNLDLLVLASRRTS